MLLAALLCFYPICLAGNPCTGSNNNKPLSFLSFFVSSIFSSRKTSTNVIFVSFFFRAFIFFSSTIPKELVNHIKSDSSVLPRIGALREVTAYIIPSLVIGFNQFLLLIPTFYADEHGVFPHR